MTRPHIVIGSGSVGTRLAMHLAEAGKQVILVSRSGSGPLHRHLELRAGDAASVESLRSAAPDAQAVYNCVNPPHYHRWETEWPPIARAIADYAIGANAVLVTCSNLYGYGPCEGPMTEDMPLRATWRNGRVRAQMWEDAKARHDAGTLRATEVRGSDYICASDQSRMGDRVVPVLQAGKRVQLLGSIDQPHTWTDPDDVARLMAVVATDERAWGSPWHVPSNPPKTQLQVVRDIAAELGVENPRVGSIPTVIERAIGIFNPVVRELAHTDYQFDRPFVMNDERTRQTFGLEPKPWPRVIADLVAAYRQS